MRRQRHAKIVATVGPASASPDKLRELFLAGVDTFRLNFSHGTHEDHAAVHAAIRALEKDVGHPIGILQDLQGPKIRIGGNCRKPISNLVRSMPPANSGGL
jgi:pyruvate kinase